MRTLKEVVLGHLRAGLGRRDSVRVEPVPIGGGLVRAVRRQCPEFGDVVTFLAICDAAVSAGTYPQYASLPYGEWYLYVASCDGSFPGNEMWSYLTNRKYAGVDEIISAVRLYWISTDLWSRMRALACAPRRR